MLIVKLSIFLIITGILVFLVISMGAMIVAMIAGILRIIIFARMNGYRNAYGRRIYPTTGSRVWGMTESQLEKILIVLLFIIISLPPLYFLYRLWGWMF